MQWFCMNRDLDRLDDILAAASDVMEFCAPLDRESLESQKAVRYAVLHSLTIIGEAASRLTEELRARHDQIPWAGLSPSATASSTAMATWTWTWFGGLLER